MRTSELTANRIVAPLLGAVVLVQAFARSIGPSWSDVGNPFGFVETSGHVSGWEQILFLMAQQGILGSDVTAISAGFNTDHYRSLLSIYASAVLSHWLHSTYWGFALVDLLAWWLAAWSLYVLGVRLVRDKTAALLAAVLFASSPIAVFAMWSQLLHVANSVSLVPAFLAALLIMEDERAPAWRRAAELTLALFCSSLVYNYHWVVVPCLLALGITSHRRAVWMATVSVGVSGFLGLTWVVHRALAASGIVLHAQVQDPLVLVQSGLSQWSQSGNFWQLLVSHAYVLPVVVSSYGAVILVLAAVGSIFALWRLRILLAVGTALGLGAGALYAVPWVVMNGYPFVYLCAGLAIWRGPRWILDQGASRLQTRTAPDLGGDSAAYKRNVETAAALVTLALLIVALWTTNQDLLGDYGFVAQWWRSWYVLR